ncbi:MULTISPECIES: thiamine phosphate synthase [Flavobacterium]|uniref:Thiamine phosphate synthase n=1 Tax=Flavobacterium hankyongi TaxID=1176532 RepID=A0ABP8ZN63_9FLAO|nr:thiamine phosphate synthase [Flavobacterium sp. N1846]
MIVITNPIAVSNETNIIHSLFENGLELLHVRKPDYSETEMISFLTAVGSDYKKKLVLHSHHHLANEFGISRIHYTQKDRNTDLMIHNPAFKSTSAHSVEEFNTLENFDYAFLSPVHPSISKSGYVSPENLLESVKNRTNFSTKLIALGGISPENISETLKKGFDDVALLGTLWNSTNTLENFKKCQQVVHSF